MFPGTFIQGDFLTVTATGPGGNTSELSPCYIAPAASTGIISLDPSAEVAGSQGFELTVTGVLLENGSQIRWDGVALATSFDGPNQLRADISAALLGDTKATVQVDVIPPGGGNPPGTNDLPFAVQRSSSDINCDGTVTTSDLQFLLEILVGLAVNGTLCPNDADLGGGGETLGDPVWVAKELAGLVEPLASLFQ
jgi:hypothetical protein